MDEPQIRHTFKIVPEAPTGYMSYWGFSAKAVIPIWRPIRDRNGTIRLEEDWMPTAVRGVTPLAVIQRIEQMISVYVKSGTYRRAKKR